MNVKKTHEYFEAKGIVAIRADKGVSKTAGQIDSLLQELGNRTKAIPFYAIYPPGGGEPEVLEGLIYSNNVIETFEGFDGGKEGEGETATAELKPSGDESSNEKSGEKKVAVRN